MVDVVVPQASEPLAFVWLTMSPIHRVATPSLDQQIVSVDIGLVGQAVDRLTECCLVAMLWLVVIWWHI
ncbi:hypothetical protein C480_19934 [Natrialba aegyptia DSM 13077]|uniref:Uncharacterized protein n=1 Tax=Natrialba aegyptia DSM 13077 TaxID=1227491 RepID=M0AMM4_9EURY|nr:hypothetical protein C480_19934 [Natrialba aegyptia DSM 13077]